MTIKSSQHIKFHAEQLYSKYLGRVVYYDLYVPKDLDKDAEINLLLINDGQDLKKMDFINSLDGFVDQSLIKNLISVGIHAGTERKQEYGVAGFPDYLHRGSKATNYTSSILDEIIPEIKRIVAVENFSEKYFLGFSLGGLMAFDIVLDNPVEFKVAGVFSGSFWWRSIALGENYVENQHRIMHRKVRGKSAESNQRYFFQAGSLDEASDRNNNGIIDSIDDTIDLIKELEKIGYQGGSQVSYYELEGGKHDVESWAKVVPVFLKWLIQVNK